VSDELERVGRIVVHRHGDEHALAQAVARAVRMAIEDAIGQRETASLVVTGGSTPKAYYPLLATLDVPWDRVWLTLSDERWVEPSHAESNERLVRDLLLRERAAAARFLPLKTHALTPEQGATDLASRLAALPHPYDLVLLGVGADSHIASLFPGAAGVDAALADDNPRHCVAITPPPEVRPALPRLSLTLAELKRSLRILIAARGDDKLAAVERAAGGLWPTRSPIAELAQRDGPPVEFHWCP
jgi:6-phosphogluconolactonase